MLAILASLVVALTVTPALSYMLLTGRAASGREAPLTRWLKRLYRARAAALVRPSLRGPGRPAGRCSSLTGAAATRLGQEFLPKFQETDFLMHFVEKPGTSVEAMQRMTVQASKELRAIPGVRNFGSHIGRAEVADEVGRAQLHRTLDQHRPGRRLPGHASRRSKRSSTPTPACTATC